MNADLAALIAELLAEFLDELPMRCNNLEDAVMALEAQQAGAFDELFRQIHSLKGTGGGVGMPVITTICHQFESFISEARGNFDRRAASTALAYVDLLRRTLAPGGRESPAVTAIEQALDQLRVSNLLGRASIFVAEPSQTLRRVFQEEFANPSRQVHMVDSGMQALERLLHEPFDVLIISRELPNLNGLAVVGALREARCRNSDIPVILVSSNTNDVPAHLRIHAIARRDVHLIPRINRHIDELLAHRCSN
jgi:CheY-like chemotaxis protein